MLPAVCVRVDAFRSATPRVIRRRLRGSSGNSEVGRASPYFYEGLFEFAKRGPILAGNHYEASRAERRQRDGSWARDLRLRDPLRTTCNGPLEPNGFARILS